VRRPNNFPRRDNDQAGYYRTPSPDNNQVRVRREFRTAGQRLDGRVLADGDGTRAGMNPMRIRKWTRQRRSARAQTASRGIESSTAPVWYLFRTASRVTTRSNLALGGSGFSSRRWTSQLRPREYCRDLLHTPRVAGNLILRFGLQHINNPGYNRDRGPVIVQACGCIWSSRCLYAKLLGSGAKVC